VARFEQRDIERLLGDPGIVRNRLKVESAVDNAQRVLDVREEHGSFAEYVWSFVGGEPLVGAWQTVAEIPAETAESRALSKDLKRRGFRFVGPTVCYAFMQAAGLVDDHTLDCFRRAG
jgi:DNA-3-methyladenine glycosylase I